MKSLRRDVGRAISFTLFLRHGHAPDASVTIHAAPGECKVLGYFFIPAAERRAGAGRLRSVPIQCQCCSIPDAFLLPRKLSPDLADIKRAELEFAPGFFPRAAMSATFPSRVHTSREPANTRPPDRKRAVMASRTLNRRKLREQVESAGAAGAATPVADVPDRKNA